MNKVLKKYSKKYPRYKPSLTLEAWKNKMTGKDFNEYLLKNKVPLDLFNP